MNPLHLILLALTLDAHTGEELHRQRVADTPVYDSVDDCSVDLQAQGIRHVIDGRVVVYVCQVLLEIRT